MNDQGTIAGSKTSRATNTDNILMKTEPRGTPVILGTDWHSDSDDAVAIRILGWAHKHGIVKLLGVSIDSAMEYSVASMRAFLRHEGMPEIPIGLDHNAYDYGGRVLYQPRLAAQEPEPRCNDGCESSLRLYRRLLGAASQKVDLIEIGFSQVIAELLNSKADDISPLSGMELVAQKVKKLWIMGGNWNGEGICEFNFSKTQKASKSIHCVVEELPVPITFLGLEIGRDVICGGCLKDYAPKDALAQILADHGAADGRFSWDPMLCYLACVGNEELAGYRLIRGHASVNADTGANSFVPDALGKHGYVVRIHPKERYERWLDEILLDCCSYQA